MTFKLDPVSTLEAIQKAKGWQGQQFSGNTSSMNFSPGLVARSGSDRAVQDIGLSPQEIITPEIPFSTNATNTILGGQIDAYGDQAELAMQAFGLQAEVGRAKKQYEFAKKLAEKRNKKKGGGGFGDILSGAISGAKAGASLGPYGALAGAVIGGGSTLLSS